MCTTERAHGRSRGSIHNKAMPPQTPPIGCKLCIGRPFLPGMSTFTFWSRSVAHSEGGRRCSKSWATWALPALRSALLQSAARTCARRRQGLCARSSLACQLNWASVTGAFCHAGSSTRVIFCTLPCSRGVISWCSACRATAEVSALLLYFLTVLSNAHIA